MMLSTLPLAAIVLSTIACGFGIGMIITQHRVRNNSSNPVRNRIHNKAKKKPDPVESTALVPYNYFALVDNDDASEEDDGYLGDICLLGTFFCAEYYYANEGEELAAIPTKKTLLRLASGKS